VASGRGQEVLRHWINEREVPACLRRRWGF
jgi:hypothetical protein